MSTLYLLQYSLKKILISRRAYNIFSYDKQKEFARFFIVFWQGKKINYDRKEIVDIEWLSLEDLLKRKEEYSAIARYWVENINWEKGQ